MARTGALFAAITLVVTSACSASARAAGDGFDEHAAAVVRAWSSPDQHELWESSLVPAGPLTVEPDWVGRDDLRDGLHAGKVDWISETVGDSAGTAVVDYADGAAQTVATLGARAALSQLLDENGAGGPRSCASSCTPVVVTSAVPTSLHLLTARGPAQVPAWAFSLEGVAHPVVHASVSAVTAPEDLEPLVPTTTLGADVVGADALVSSVGTRLTVRYAVSSCAVALAPRVSEADAVVVVAATQPSTVRRGCASVLREREEVVDLARPLGDRVLVTTGGRLVLPVG